MVEIIDGKALAAELKQTIKSRVENLKADKGFEPGLAVVMVGDNSSSQIYVNNKKKACEEVGIRSIEHVLPTETSQEALIELIKKLNADKSINGILVQLPLPNHIDQETVLPFIDPAKDVDGLHPMNIGALVKGSEGLVPCTPLGCIMLIKKAVKNMTGLHAVVVGRSSLVGKPVAELLLKENCTVTICHSKTKNIEEITRTADILVSATGCAKFVKASWVKAGAIVIDVGIIRQADGKINGDVDFDEVSQVAGFMTKVPGGVGPMTIACLLANTFTAACRQNGIADSY